MRSAIMLVATIYLAFAVPPSLADDSKRGDEGSSKNYKINMDEIIVSVPMQEKVSASAKPVDILKGDELRLKIGNTIGETLKLEPGIHSQSHGTNVGLPVIRGQTGPRVRVLSNGLGSNDVSQASPDHASSVAPELADKIEVLRGPATLMYGSGAIGGVVNVIDNRIPDQVPDKLVGGVAEQRFNSVANETSSTLKLEGGKDHLAYHLDGFFRDRGNVSIGGSPIDIGRAQVSEPDLNVTRNARGTLRNSAADSMGGSAGFSYVGDAGFIGISGNRLENNYGIPMRGTEDADRVRILLEQNKFDLKGELKDPIAFLESVRLRLSNTDYQHREVTNGQLETVFKNNTYEGRVEAPHKSFAGLNGVLGFQAISSEFSGIKPEANVAFVPLSRSNNFGIFAQESFNLGAFTTQFGARVEHASVDPLNTANPYRDYVPISASASELWNINEQNSLSLAFTRSQRAPQVQELHSIGYHDATRSFERGNINLNKETSHNLDVGYKLKANWVVAQLDLFHNWIDDYIFQQRTGAMIDDAPEVAFRQTRANFMGYEGKLIFPLMDNKSGLVDLTLFSDYTRGRLLDKGDVPQMPPLRWGFQLDYIKGDWVSNLRLTRAETQNNSGFHEANTPGYLLLNVSSHYHVANIYGADVMVFAKGNNLLDENIRNSTSFLRNFAPEPGRGAEIGLRINY